MEVFSFWGIRKLRFRKTNDYLWAQEHIARSGRPSLQIPYPGLFARPCCLYPITSVFLSTEEKGVSAQIHYFFDYCWTLITSTLVIE